jgi:hypothetical protein
MKRVVAVLLDKHFKSHDSILCKIHVGGERLHHQSVFVAFEEEVFIEWSALKSLESVRGECSW